MKTFAKLSSVCILTILMTNPNLHAEEKSGLQGSWLATWTVATSTIPNFPTPFTFSALHAFHEGGTVTSVDDDSFDSTGIGIWKRTAGTQYTFSITYFLADDQAPSHSSPLMGSVAATIRFDAVRDLWIGEFRSALRDRQGNVIGRFTGTVKAARLN